MKRATYGFLLLILASVAFGQRPARCVHTTFFESPAKTIPLASPPTVPTQSGRHEPPVLFVVGKADDGSTVIDPMVILDRGRFVDAKRLNNGEPRALSKGYFATGRKYRLLFGGGEAGSVTVSKRINPVPGYEACDWAAVVDVSSSVRIGGQVWALATNVNALGKRASYRRAPTTDERARAIGLAEIIYPQHGAPLSLVSAISVGNLTAIDVDGDGRGELAGSFVIKQGDNEHALFFLAKQGTGVYASELTIYNLSNSREPEIGLTQSVSLVDVLDLDGDGICELITKNQQPQGVSYQIYKRAGGQWKQIFNGAGYGCE
jgi:hypothetical protein